MPRNGPDGGFSLSFGNNRRVPQEVEVQDTRFAVCDIIDKLIRRASGIRWVALFNIILSFPQAVLSCYVGNDAHCCSAGRDSIIYPGNS